MGETADEPSQSRDDPFPTGNGTDVCCWPSAVSRSLLSTRNLKPETRNVFLVFAVTCPL